MGRCRSFGGQLRFGIPFPPIGVRAEMLREACLILKSMWTNKRTTFCQAAWATTTIDEDLGLTSCRVQKTAKIGLSRFQRNPGWDTRKPSPETRVETRVPGISWGKWCLKGGNCMLRILQRAFEFFTNARKAG